MALPFYVTFDEIGRVTQIKHAKPYLASKCAKTRSVPMLRSDNQLIGNGFTSARAHGFAKLVWVQTLRIPMSLHQYLNQ